MSEHDGPSASPCVEDMSQTQNQTQTQTPPQHEGDQRRTGQPHQDTADPPPRPVPSSDPRLAVPNENSPVGATTSPVSSGDQNDLFKVKPLEALRLLSASVEFLVHMTGDVPPTPPLRTPTNPMMSDMQAEKKNIVRTISEKSLVRLRQQAEKEDAARARRLKNGSGMGGDTTKGLTEGGDVARADNLQTYNAALSTQLMAQQQQHTSLSEIPSEPAIDGVRLKRSPPINARAENEPYIIIGADSQPINLQHGAITRKFYSKNEPPISINQYLLRLHQFCPMSTAVYLATSLYIHRLAVEERAIPVTKRNAHRLVLAGLRVAMKALEDLSYPHNKIAKVGGVSESELARLEISFCFLAGFELLVNEETMRRHWETLKESKQMTLKGMEVPTLKLEKPRHVSTLAG